MSSGPADMDDCDVSHAHDTQAPAITSLRTWSKASTARPFLVQGWAAHPLRKMTLAHASWQCREEPGHTDISRSKVVMSLHLRSCPASQPVESVPPRPRIRSSFTTPDAPLPPSRPDGVASAGALRDGVGNWGTIAGPSVLVVASAPWRRTDGGMEGKFTSTPPPPQPPPPSPFITQHIQPLAAFPTRRAHQGASVVVSSHSSARKTPPVVSSLVPFARRPHMAAAAAGPLPLRLCQYVHMHVYLAAASPHAVSSWTASSGALLSQAFNPFGPFVAPRSLQPAWELPCRPARVCSDPAMAKKGSRSKSNARSPPRDPTSGHLGRACRKHDTMFRARPRSDCIQTCVAAFPLVSEARSKMHRLNIGSSRPRAKQGRRGGAARSGPSDHDASCRAATSQNLAPETRRYDAPRRVGVAGSKDALPPAVPWLLPLLRIAGTHVGCWVHHRPMATHTHARWCYTHAHTHTHPGSIVSCAMYPRCIATALAARPPVRRFEKPPHGSVTLEARLARDARNTTTRRDDGSPRDFKDTAAQGQGCEEGVAPVAGVTQRRGVLLSRRAIIGRPSMYEVCCCAAAPLDMSTHVIASRFLFQGAYVWVPAGAARWLAGRFSSLRPPGRLKVSNVIIRTQDEQRGPTLVGERRDDKANKTNGAEKREPPGQGVTVVLVHAEARRRLSCLPLA
ncbi:hypothetical protein PCL_01517 [Purpureocillium lilacinum]|uniref:Uncharacterized protein n=1 Tax=Purpureocillium lilacinum TaxID=33203 RepID=A0A2U3E3Q2_PURLI|nr:hypothetical protein PCL_01517 [Purpureocillium lilacinum]